jgi:hypothetical protein
LPTPETPITTRCCGDRGGVLGCWLIGGCPSRR